MLVLYKRYKKHDEFQQKWTWTIYNEKSSAHPQAKSHIQWLIPSKDSIIKIIRPPPSEESHPVTDSF